MRGNSIPKALNLFLLLPVLAVALISGCTDTWGGGATGSGVVIMNWEPDFSEVESGDEVRMRIRIQNQGGEVAEDVVAIMEGINPDEWNARDNEIDFRDMLPPNPRFGTEGEIKQDFFELEAPELPEGITETYNPQVRVYYAYLTTAIKPITIVNQDELRRLIDKGEPLPTRDTTVSGGPIRVDVITGKHIKAKTKGNPSFPITIHIENVGPGVVSERRGDEDYMIDLTINLPDGLSFETCKSRQAIELWKGDDYDLTCEIEIDDVPLINQEKTIILVLNYAYYVDSRSSITVKGTGE